MAGNDLDKAGAPPPPQRPEQYAAEFIHAAADPIVAFDPYEETVRDRRQRLLIVLSALVLLAVIVAAVVVDHKNTLPKKGSGRSASSIAAAQAVANRAAVAAGCPASPETRTNSLGFSGPLQVVNMSLLYAATVSTTAGSFIIALNRSEPAAVNNFIFLTQQGYYNCDVFERANIGQLDQTGDPTGSGLGTPGYLVPDELPAKAPDPAHQYPLGSVAMINDGTTTNSTSQWFVVTGPAGESLPPDYTIFGRVVAGMSVLERINAQGSRTGGPPAVIERVLSVAISSAQP